VADRGLTGVLLVGGQSRRFGSPKALAQLGGRTLAEIAWETLGEACDEQLAVGKDADGLELPFPILDDRTTVRTPLVGLVAGLRATQHERVVMLPVDMPLVTSELLRNLARSEAEAVMPQTGPAPVAVSKRVLPVLERVLEAGQLAVKPALERVGLRVVEVDEALLVNVNTLDDLARLDR
jgi:molybdopterin-guanine dinucleotide biosynthesis protein A